jgi:hypothetical protein
MDAIQCTSVPSNLHLAGFVVTLMAGQAMDDEPKMIPCPDCGGTGKAPLPLDNLPGPKPAELIEIECPTCGGTGEVREDTQME